MDFYERRRKGENLRNYQEAARELAYRAARTDDPRLQVMGKVAHAAEVRAGGRELAGGTHWNRQRWNPNEVD